jgi:hypothetical protein
MRHLLHSSLLAVPLPTLASDRATITQTIQGIATSVDARDWFRLDLKFGDDGILNQLSLETDEGTRVNEKTVVETWAELLPRFYRTTHEISEFEILGLSTIMARATARYHASDRVGVHVWEQKGLLDYVLKNTTEGCQVTALNTRPERESRPLFDLLASRIN